MLRRFRRTIWIVAAVVLVLAVAVLLGIKAPPKAARLLPESDGIVYVNLRPLRDVLLKSLRPVTRDPEYQSFIDATGIDWERDLDEAAVALHRMPDPNGPNGPVAYSLVLVGKLDGKTMAHYLEAHANANESYDGQTVYSLPSQDRTVRIALIGSDVIAVSNYPGTEKIHSIMDRHRAAALPFSGSTLLAEHYSEIPILSVAWAMGEIGLPFSESGRIQVFGVALPLPQDTTFLASVHWAGVLKLSVVEIADNEATAASQSANLNVLLQLAKGATAGLAASPANDSIKEILRTAAITEHRNRVEVDATLPRSMPPELLDGESGGRH